MSVRPIEILGQSERIVDGVGEHIEGHVGRFRRLKTPVWHNGARGGGGGRAWVTDWLAKSQPAQDSAAILRHGAEQEGGMQTSSVPHPTNLFSAAVEVGNRRRGPVSMILQDVWTSAIAKFLPA